MRLRLRAGSATDVGRRRSNNQDHLLVDELLFAVADGMGGHAGGEVASAEAIAALRQAFVKAPTLDGLREAVWEAHRAVQARAGEDPELAQMGTTVTAIAEIDLEGVPHLAIANVGDSRAYMLRAGELTRLTDDHSVTEELLRAGQLTAAEAAIDPRRNILTRVLGPLMDEGPDMQAVLPSQGDRFLLCSDGLYNEVGERDIAHVLRTLPDPDEAAHQLVGMANEHGGSDNITVVIVDVVDDAGIAARASAQVAVTSPSGRGQEAGGGRGAEPTPTAGAGSGAAAPGRLMSADERNAELRQIATQPDAKGEEWAPDAAARPPSEALEAPERRLTARAIAFVIALMLLAGVAVGAIAFVARSGYFVGVADDGRVAVFRGRPGGLLGFEPVVVHHTSLREAQVPTSFRDEVDDGRTFSSLEAAQSYVERMEEAASEAAPGDGAEPQPGEGEAPGASEPGGAPPATAPAPPTP